jgi:hypothetical protein
MPLHPRNDQCAVIERAEGGQWNGTCRQTPTRRAQWRFESGQMSILLCNQHAAELAGDERLTVVKSW